VGIPVRQVIGYARLDAVAAASVKSLAWFSNQTLALHPAWTFFHMLMLMLSWGLVLLAYARLHRLVDNLGRLSGCKCVSCHVYQMAVNGSTKAAVQYAVSRSFTQ